MIKLHLYHGWHDLDGKLDNWGEDGPTLVGKWVKATLMDEVTLGGLTPETLALAREKCDPETLYHDGANGWCIDMRREDGYLRFGPMLYADWDVEATIGNG